MRLLFLILNTVFLITSCNPKGSEPVVSETTTEKDTPIVAPPILSNYTAPDLSPMDMIYCPSDYPFKKMTGAATGLPYARIIYSRPQTQGRKIFGELVHYDHPWRLGANEATELELFSPATIQKKTIQPGRYIMYCIPSENSWTIILNGNLFSWGLSPDEKKNILQFEIPAEKNNTIIDYFTMAFENPGPETNLLILWDDIRVRLPIKF